MRDFIHFSYVFRWPVCQVPDYDWDYSSLLKNGSLDCYLLCADDVICKQISLVFASGTFQYSCVASILSIL